MSDPEVATAESTSLWDVLGDAPALPQLEHGLRADVCVIGAGIAGLTTAYLLGREGRTVIVLNDGPVASGQTHRTTGHLTNAIDDRYALIERWHGPDGARLTAESHTAAIDRIEEIARDESIACDFERLDGFLFVPEGEPPETAHAEFEAARRAGLSVELLPRLPWDHARTGPCVRFARQGQMHPLKYLAGLARAARRDGTRLFGNSHAASVTGGKRTAVVTAHGPVVEADAIVVATNTPINDTVVIHTKQAPYRTYVIAGRLPRGSIPRALYWDTLDPYHYVRLQSGAPGEDDWVLVGGEDHKTGQADDQEERYARLEQWTRERIPAFGDVEHHWSGQVQETIDGLAFIGRNPMDDPNVYIATGDSGMGLTHGTIAGMLLTDLICGRVSPWATLYDPARKTLRAASTYVHENANVARHYGDWLSREDVAIEDIPRRCGRIVSRGARKLAVYRDDDGNVHALSAACPHLKCVVAWNPSENTWDCPCHGSRFDRFGNVVTGPANTGLAPVKGI